MEGKSVLTKQVQRWRGEWGVLWSNTGFQNKGYIFAVTVKARACHSFTHKRFLKAKVDRTKHSRHHTHRHAHTPEGFRKSDGNSANAKHRKQLSG